MSKSKQSTYIEHRILEHHFVDDTNLQVALLTRDPDSNGLKELEGKGYSRKPVKFARKSYTLVSTVDVQFDEAMEDWDSIDALFIYSGSDSDHLVEVEFEKPYSIKKGDGLRLSKGNLTVECEDWFTRFDKKNVYN